jgi:adenylate kinase
MSDAPKEQTEETIEEVFSPGPKIIISGGPASGKGTQCDFIVKEWNVVHLSSGDMLRAAAASGSEAGLKAKEFMDAGKLVPDDLIINIVAHRVMEKDCRERGFVLDGFPRTAEQVQALVDAGVQCDVFLQIDVDDEEIIKRVAGRRMDPVTGKIYHMTYLPPPEDIVERLEQRDDDTEDKVKVRLATYHKNLAGIVDNFAHCTVAVDTNNKNPDQIWGEFRNGMKRFVIIGDPNGTSA